MTTTDTDELRRRVAEAEEIIRAQDRLMQIMYDGNSPSGTSISKKCGELMADYEQRYGVNLLDGEE